MAYTVTVIGRGFLSPAKEQQLTEYLALSLQATLRPLYNFVQQGKVLDEQERVQDIIERNFKTHRADLKSITVYKDEQFFISVGDAGPSFQQGSSDHSHSLADITSLTGSLLWEPSATTGYVLSADITVTGAQLGDFVLVAAPYNLNGVIAYGYVKAANTVVIALANLSGSAVTLPSGTWKVCCLR